MINDEERAREELSKAFDTIMECAGILPLEDLKLPMEVQQRAILKAVRRILRCGEGESVLMRAVTVIRRHDNMAKELGNNFS